MDKIQPFIKFMRTKETDELLRYLPNAFLLLTLIAMRAKRTDEFSALNLKPGEALIGDYASCGLTEQKYRTAKDHLESHGFATFQPTNKGTVATLCDARVYDINIESTNGQDNGQITDDQRTDNGRVTTIKNDKKYKNEKNEKNNSILGGNVNDGQRHSMTTEHASTEGNKTWLTPFGEAWKERMGGEMPYGKVAKPLRALIDEHGQDVVLAAFTKYIKATDVQYVSVPRFSQTFGAWNKAPPAPAERPDGPRPSLTKEELEHFKALKLSMT